MLALAFLILVGVALVAEGFELHIPKGYIYFAMAFSFGVEMLNLRLRKARTPVKLHKEIERKAQGQRRSAALKAMRARRDSHPRARVPS